MNILFLDQFSQLGGAQRCLLEVLPAIAGRGWGMCVAAPGNGELLARARALGGAAETIQCGPYSLGHKTPADFARFAWEAPRLAQEVRALIRSTDADLVYVNGPRLLPAAALAASDGPPVLFHAHSCLEGYARQIAGWTLRAARATVVACCRFVAAPLAPYCRNGEARIVYNGVASSSLAHRAASGSAFRIGTIGRVAPEKGQADCLRAARILQRDFPQCRFVICGAPLFGDARSARYFHEVQELARGLPVEFTGWTDTVADVLANLDLLVVPSTPIDAAPLVILEAFAAGVPVMAFASGGIPELIEHDVTGFLVKERSPEALASAMRRLLTIDPRRLREVSAGALARTRDEFSLERYRARILESIEAARQV